MKLVFTIALICFALNFYAQIPGRDGFMFDENGEKISQQVFEQKARTGDYTWIIRENKDSITAHMLLREEYGTITSQDRKKLVETLKILTGKPIREDQVIIINYFIGQNSYPNQAPCIGHYTSDKSYLRFIRKNEQYFQAFISGKDFSYTKDFVYEDKQDVIKKILFKYAAECGNYCIIKPDGKFYRVKGEYNQDKIPEKLKEHW